MEDTFKNLLVHVQNSLESGDNVEINLCISEAQKYLTSLTNNEDLSHCHFALYHLFLFKREYETSLNHLKEALKQTSNPQRLYTLLLEQGLCYMHMKQKENGLNAFQRAFDVACTNNDYHEMANACNLIGKYYYLEADWIKSFEYFNDMKKYAHIINNSRLKSEAHMQIGSIFYKEGKLSLALETFREAEETAVDCHNHYLAYRAAIKRCKIYWDMNKMEQVGEIIKNLYYMDDPLEK